VFELDIGNMELRQGVMEITEVSGSAAVAGNDEENDERM